jgi:hypothetical protein
MILEKRKTKKGRKKTGPSKLFKFPEIVSPPPSLGHRGMYSMPPNSVVLLKDAVLCVWLCGNFTVQPYVCHTCGKRVVGIFFLRIDISEIEVSAHQNTGFNEERVLSVWTGSADKI